MLYFRGWHGCPSAQRCRHQQATLPAWKDTYHSLQQPRAAVSLLLVGPSILPSPTLHSPKPFIAAAVKSRRARMSARLMPGTRRGKLLRETDPPAAHQPVARESCEQSCRRGPQCSFRLPKATSIGADLTLLGHGRSNTAQGPSASILGYQATPQGPLEVAELTASRSDIPVQMPDLPLEEQMEACQHSMTRLPVSPEGSGQMEYQAAGPFATSSQCSTQLSADSMGREPWEQVCLRLTWLCRPVSWVANMHTYLT